MKEPNPVAAKEEPAGRFELVLANPKPLVVLSHPVAYAGVSCPEAQEVLNLFLEEQEQEKADCRSYFAACELVSKQLTQGQLTQLTQEVGLNGAVLYLKPIGVHRMAKILSQQLKDLLIVGRVEFWPDRKMVVHLNKPCKEAVTNEGQRES